MANPFAETVRARLSPLQRVLQLDPEGCGPACVAMVLGIKYGEAVRLFWPTGRARKAGTTTRQVREALAKGGADCGERLLRAYRGMEDVRSLDHHAILHGVPAVGWEGMGHWVLWDARRGLVLDPGFTPSGSMRIVSYLPVWV